MPKISLELEEQLTDSRSNEIAYRLKIINLGLMPLSLMSINPQIPEGVELIEVKDSSTVAAKERHVKLCEDLTLIVKDYLLVSFEEIQEKIIEIEKRLLREIINDLNSVWKVYFNMFSGVLENRVEVKRKEESSIHYKIYNSTDADIAYEKWFKDSDPESAILTNLFNVKLEQLKSIENIIGEDASAAAISTIEPDSFYATTYILKCERSFMTLKKFNFAIDCSFIEKDKEEDHLESVATSIAISPTPYILSFIAILSAFLGVILKYSAHADTPSKSNEYFNYIYSQLITGPGISSAILALLLFNIFEHTSLGDKIKIGIGWRSALLVGVVCGLFSERMIDSIKVLVGI